MRVSSSVRSVARNITSAFCSRLLGMTLSLISLGSISTCFLSLLLPLRLLLSLAAQLSNPGVDSVNVILGRHLVFLLLQLVQQCAGLTHRHVLHFKSIPGQCLRLLGGAQLATDAAEGLGQHLSGLRVAQLVGVDAVALEHLALCLAQLLA